MADGWITETVLHATDTFGSDKVPRGKMAGLPEPLVAGKMVLPPATLARALFSKSNLKMTDHQESNGMSAWLPGRLAPGKSPRSPLGGCGGLRFAYTGKILKNLLTNLV